jgi:hypothetical protein
MSWRSPISGFFPARELLVDPRLGIGRRHHAHEQAMQRAVKQAVLMAEMAKSATPIPCAIMYPS